MRGFPPSFTRNRDTVAEMQSCFRSVRGLRTSLRSTNEPLSAISPAETVTGLRLRRSMRTDIVWVLSSSWADLCATTCWPRIECVHAQSTPSTHIPETSNREKSVDRHVSALNFRKVSDKTNICPLVLLVTPAPAGNLRVNGKRFEGAPHRNIQLCPPILLPGIGMHMSPSILKTQSAYFRYYVTWN